MGAGLVHGAEQVCLAIRLLSGAGIAAASSGVRCAAVDELPPRCRARRARGLERRRPDRDARSERCERRVVLPGAARRRSRSPLRAARSRSPARARTCCASSRATAQATRPSPSARSESMRPLRRSARVAADFLAREVRVGVADALVRRRARRGAPRRHRARDDGSRPTAAPRSRGCRPASRSTAPPSRCGSFDASTPANASELSDQPARAPAAGAHAA